MKLGGNILILTHWSYKDALIQTYTLPYVEIIRKIVPAEVKIVVITAEQERIALQLSEVDTINAEWGKENMQLMAQPYKRFGWRKIFAGITQLIALYKFTRRNKVAVIHAFCTPAGGIGYILSKLTGKELVIDSYEPHAESMVEAGSWKKTGLAFKILFWLEKKLSERAIHIIATTVGMKGYAKEKYNVDLKSFFVKPACIDFEEFYPREKDEVLLKELQLNEKIVCVYAGKLGGTYLRDELFDFVKGCYDYWGDRFRFLMLTSTPGPEIQQQIKKVGLPENIVTSRFVKHAEIPRYLSLGDFGINPQVPVPSKRFGSPIKNGEYWGMGLPVVISPDISDDSDIIIENKIGVVINLQRIENLPEAVKQMDSLLKTADRKTLQEKIFEVAKQYRSFDIARRIYPMIYEN